MRAEPQIPARYEYKYVIPEYLVPPIRAAISPFCELDAHSAAAADRQYEITSLYFDTPDRAFYRAKALRQQRRFKLRIRTYGSGPDRPVFFEVKRKVDEVVLKGRCRVAADGWRERLLGGLPADAERAERDFRALLESYGAQPTLLARYRREAYVSTVDAYARVTLDRRLQYQAWPRWDLDADPRLWSAQDDVLATRGLAQGLVLELKSTAAVPLWMTALVRRFDLLRCGFSKYCTGVDRLWGAEDLSRAHDRVPMFAFGGGA